MAHLRQETIETEIPASEVTIGMHVVRLDRPWEETNFLLQGFIVQTPDEIHAIQEQCQSVFVEGKVERKAVFEGNRASRIERSSSWPQQRVRYVNKVETARELDRVSAHFKYAKDIAASIMSNIRLGRMLDLNQVRTVVDQTVDSVLRNENALLLLSKIKNKDEYTAEHCINVSILCAAFGKHLGMLDGEIRKLALCGMLHDVGKMRIDDSILNKPGALTPDEFAIMKQHTTLGRDVLAGIPSMEHAAVDVALSHHERMDGEGYPRGLKSEFIPLFAKLVGLVDTYDAITSSRIYDKGRASMQALQIIHKNKGTQFDAELAVEFIRMIGVYPPGSIVEMTNGEVGIVISTSRGSKLTPRVLLVRDANKHPISPYRQLDLSKGTLDANGAPYKIGHEIPDETYGIVMKSFIEQGVLSQPAPEVLPFGDDGHRQS